MKKIEIKEFGGPEVLEVKNADIGKPGQNEVLVKNSSIGINYIDTYHRFRSLSHPVTKWYWT